MMKRWWMLVAMVAMGSMLGPGSIAHAQNFRNNALNGRYSLMLSGTDTTNNAPVALSGFIEFNGRGGVSAGAVSLADGPDSCSADLTPGGSYTVNSNGTGAINLMLAAGSSNCSTLPASSFSLALALYKNGRQANVSSLSTSIDLMVLSGTMSWQKNFQ